MKTLFRIFALLMVGLSAQAQLYRLVLTNTQFFVSGTGGSSNAVMKTNLISSSPWLTVSNGYILGRSVGAGVGAAEHITIGANLSLLAGTLNATGGGGSGTSNSFDVNQFIVTDGTNVHIATGALLTNVAIYNIGTTNTVAHGNAAGNWTFGPVQMPYDIVGITPVTNGGSGGNTFTGPLHGSGTSPFTAGPIDLSSSDASGILASARFPALTGDGTTPGGSLVFTLASVVAPSTATKITYNAKGLVTAGASAGLASSDFANQGTTNTLLHGNAAGNPSWASVLEYDLGLTDIATANSSTSAHGFLKKLNNVAADFMNGQGNWAVPPGTNTHVGDVLSVSGPSIFTWANPTTTATATLNNQASNTFLAGPINGAADATPTFRRFGVSDFNGGLSATTNTVWHGGVTWSAVSEYDLSFQDVVNANSSTAQHGLLKKLSNVASEFMNGQGNWSTPAGAGTVTSVSGPSIFTWANPTTTPTATLNNVSSNKFLAGPINGGADAAPTFREFELSDFNGGLGATATTFWRGDKTWATPVDTTANWTASGTTNSVLAGNAYPYSVLVSDGSSSFYSIGFTNHATNGFYWSAGRTHVHGGTSDLAIGNNLMLFNAGTANLTVTPSILEFTIGAATLLDVTTTGLSVIRDVAYTWPTTNALAGQIFASDASGNLYWTNGGAGTVTSVGLTVPSILSVSGSPVTSSGTLAVTLATETANTVFAGPTSGGAATPTFRALVTADLPAGVGTITGSGATGFSAKFTGASAIGNGSLFEDTGIVYTSTDFAPTNTLTYNLGSSSKRWLAIKGGHLDIGGETYTLASGNLPVVVSGTWNGAGELMTAVSVDMTDTASAATSLLAALKIGGSAKFTVDKTGEVKANSNLLPITDLTGNVGNSSFRWAGFRGGNMILSGTTGTTISMIDASQTWNNGSTVFEGIKLKATDTASAANSFLMTLQLGSTTNFAVAKDGNLVRLRNVPYLWPATNSLSGQLLASDTAGNLYWTNVSGGGSVTLDAVLADAASSQIINGAFTNSWLYTDPGAGNASFIIKSTNSSASTTFGLAGKMTSATAKFFNVTETTASSGGSGSQYLANFETLASSTATPWRIASRGNEIAKASYNSTQILGANGSAAAPTYSLSSGTGSGMYYNAGLSLANAGLDVIQASGANVAIAQDLSLAGGGVPYSTHTATAVNIFDLNGARVGLFGTNLFVSLKTKTGNTGIGILPDATRPLSIEMDALGVTPNAGIIMSNVTPAVVGTSQVTPGLFLQGQAWSTTASGTSVPYEWRQYGLGVNSAAGTASLNWALSISNATATIPMSLSASTLSVPNITMSVGSVFLETGRGQISWPANGSFKFTDGNTTEVASIQANTTNFSKATSYTLLDLDSGSAINNSNATAAVVYTLPTARTGMHFWIDVATNFPVAVVAVGSDTIRVGGTVTAAAGGVTNSLTGSSIHLKCYQLINGGGGQWMVDNQVGTWTISAATQPEVVARVVADYVRSNDGAAGATTWTLPAASRDGGQYTFIINAAQNGKIVCTGTDLIRFGDQISTATTGDINSSSIGSTITVTALKAGLWMVTSSVGSWTVN